MEPAAGRREHLGAGVAAAYGIEPQWSPLWTGGSTWLVWYVADQEGAPQ